MLVNTCWIWTARSVVIFFFTVVNLRFRLAVDSHSDHKFDDELLYGFFHLIFRVWIPCSN